MAGAQKAPEGRGCPLCGSLEAEPFLTAVDRLYPRAENHDYARCTSCPMIYLSPMPNSDVIRSYYGAGYTPHAPADASAIRRRLGRPLNRFVVRHRLAPSSPRSGLRRAAAALMAPFAMADTLMPHGRCRLLEVGCGSGRWMYRHRLLGWQTEGVEPSEDACREASSLGLPVHHGDIFSVPTDRRYDVIAFRSVLEHVWNPVETLRRARDLLAPGGRLVLSVPNIASWSFRRFGTFWYPLDPPRHLLQFTSQSLVLLGRRANLEAVALRSEFNSRMILNSWHYSRAFPRDIIERRDLEVRLSCIERAKEALGAKGTRQRWREALLVWQARLAGGPGAGEMIQAALEPA
jgi:SAM-dependent methyltransferase